MHPLKTRILWTFISLVIPLIVYCSCSKPAQTSWLDQVSHAATTSRTSPPLYLKPKTDTILHSDHTCLLQGMVNTADDNVLIQCCGGFADSRVQYLNFSLNSTILIWKPDPEVFLEGCAWSGPNELTVLTWRNGIAFRILFDATMPPDSLKPFPIKVFSTTFHLEGWGLTSTNHPDLLISSDGSSNLYALKKTSLTVVSYCSVRLSGQPVRYINALTSKNGLIFANIFTPVGLPGNPGWVLVVDSRVLTGSSTNRRPPPDRDLPLACPIVALLPLFGRESSQNEQAVMNGLAWHKKDKLVVGGKLFPHMHAIQFEPTRELEEGWQEWSVDRISDLNIGFR